MKLDFDKSKIYVYNGYMAKGNEWTPDREADEAVRVAIVSYNDALGEGNFMPYEQFRVALAGYKYELMSKIAQKNPDFSQEKIMSATECITLSILRIHGMSGSGISDQGLEEARRKAEAILGVEQTSELRKETEEEVGRLAILLKEEWAKPGAEKLTAVFTQRESSARNQINEILNKRNA